jgi:Metallo-beta-lactamase superfamily domain
VIISKSASDTWLASNFWCVNDSYGIAPSLDLGLLSHRVLPHPGLCLYAYSRSGLKTPAYSTLPVQTMARIAATEEADDIRDEEDVSSAEEQAAPSSEGDAHVRDRGTVTDLPPHTCESRLQLAECSSLTALVILFLSERHLHHDTFRATSRLLQHGELS